jgi:opacity protein-like surface antigen
MKTYFTAVIVSIIMSAASTVFAEGFFDMFGGPSFTETASFTMSSKVTSVTGDISFRPDITYGLRGGYWFKNHPWLGVGGDFSSLHSRGKDTKVDILAVTPSARIRLPMFVNEEMPQGWVQPYMGIGPSLPCYTYVGANLGPPTNGISGTRFLASTVGVQVPAGILVQLSQRLAFFTEYRYSYYTIDVDQNTYSQIVQNIFNDDNAARNVKTRLSMHNLLFGVSFGF